MIAERPQRHAPGQQGRAQRGGWRSAAAGGAHRRRHQEGEHRAAHRRAGRTGGRGQAARAERGAGTLVASKRLAVSLII